MRWYFSSNASNYTLILILVNFEPHKNWDNFSIWGLCPQTSCHLRFYTPVSFPSLKSFLHHWMPEWRIYSECMHKPRKFHKLVGITTIKVQPCQLVWDAGMPTGLRSNIWYKPATRYCKYVLRLRVKKTRLHASSLQQMRIHALCM